MDGKRRLIVASALVVLCLGTFEPRAVLTWTTTGPLAERVSL